MSPTSSPLSALRVLRKWRMTLCLSPLVRNLWASSILIKLPPGDVNSNYYKPLPGCQTFCQTELFLPATQLSLHWLGNMHLLQPSEEPEQALLRLRFLRFRLSAQIRLYGAEIESFSIYLLKLTPGRWLSTGKRSRTQS